MAISDEIHTKLAAAFDPSTLEVINESHLHAGHAGDDGSGESHFRVVVHAKIFSDMNRLARHRAVHSAIGADLIGKIHALSLDIDAG